MYPTVKKIVSEWLAICPIKACSVVDVPQKIEQPHTLNDPTFQEDDSKIHEIDIDKNEISNTLNDLNSILIDMEEGEKEEKKKDKDEDEDRDKDDDKDEDGDDDDDDDE
ncbi:putative transmembrane protein DDB-like [Capsicum annuum]